MTRVLMLGWEFPPFISGGLGTACYGLTRAMSRRGMQVTFVLPRSGGDGDHNTHSHVDLVAPSGTEDRTIPAGPTGSAGANDPAGVPARSTGDGETVHESGGRVTIVDIPARITSPYAMVGSSSERTWSPGSRTRVGPGGTTGHAAPGMDPNFGSSDYGDDLVGEVERYAHFCLQSTRDVDFDVIHAHDWLTYPAGVYLARATGKPLVVHVHSTEFDRSGEHVNQTVYDIERCGLHEASRVATVSRLTKNVVTTRYGVSPDKVNVIYNGVELEPHRFGIRGIKARDKVVLYFGRITYQKGPEYFVRAAKRVLEVMDDVKFVVAGNGDQAAHMIQMAADLGIGNKILFTGFLRGDNIKRIFSIADLYVMPSISEPFGIAPLEAVGHDVPALISKTSGVSEILTHALKVDFWDVDQMANQIVAVLRHGALHRTLREHGAMEVRSIKWDGAAQRCEELYRSVIADPVCV